VKSRIFHTQSEDETIAAGEKLAAELPPKTVVLLIGNGKAGAYHVAVLEHHLPASAQILTLEG